MVRKGCNTRVKAEVGTGTKDNHQRRRYASRRMGRGTRAYTVKNAKLKGLACYLVSKELQIFRSATRRSEFRPRGVYVDSGVRVESRQSSKYLEASMEMTRFGSAIMRATQGMTAPLHCAHAT